MAVSGSSRKWLFTGVSVNFRSCMGHYCFSNCISSSNNYNTHVHGLSALSVTTQVSQYQKDKTNLNFTETRDSEWQWHQLDHMQVCTLLQTDNNASTPSLCFLQAGCYSCHPTNSIKALKAIVITVTNWKSWKKTALF